MFIFFFILGLIIFLGAFAAQKTGAKNMRGVISAKVLGIGIIFGAFLFNIITIIPAGSVGVVDVFGKVSSGTLKPGMNLVNPFAKVVSMSTQTQEVKEVMDSPSKEGLTVQVEQSVLFHLNPELAPEVYKTVGENYVPIILEPQFRSVTRGVTSMFEAKALYTADRVKVEQLEFSDLDSLVKGRGIIIESTPLRRVGLPPNLAASIEDKLQKEQQSQAMQFVLQKEKQEAERKAIEAQGISDFQRIVAQGISEPLLKWKGIEATELLAKSQNAKVVVIGSGKDGLPLILNADR